ncbi:MAG: O-antigen ligase family protein [Chthoniobacteraceae bacterium]
MDYAALIIFLVMHYVRPQEWSSFFTQLRPIQLLAVLALYALYQRRESVRLRDLWCTPQDYMVTAYFAWTVFASPTPSTTFRSILPLIFFYFVGVLTLTSLPRLKKFLGWWAVSIVFISALAIASTLGFDPLDSASITQWRMKGRLVLNLSIFNNPNALAHAIVPVIPMLYYLLFWKRTFSKPLILVIIIPITCILMTLSKGAFLAGAVTIFATLTFGRPKKVQIAMAVLAFAFGGTLIYAMPRMSELKSSKSDAAIQGRVAAFQFGLHQMQHLTFGHGLGNFQEQFFRYGPVEKVKKMRTVHGRHQFYYIISHYYKAPHSAYNQNGADLGFTGFFLFIGVMYCSLRTLAQAKTINNDEELLRRTLFAIVVSYAVSAWMVDFCYRPTFFLFTAATSAFHRHLRGLLALKRKSTEDEEAQAIETNSVWLRPEDLPRSADDSSASVAVETLPTVEVRTPQVVEPSSAPQEELHGSINWQRIGWVDLMLTYLLTKGAVRLWVYAIENM